MSKITAPPAPIFGSDAELAAATPAQIDEHLSRLGHEEARLLFHLARIRETVYRRARDKVVTRFYGKTDAELAELTEQAEAELTDVRFQARPLNAEYTRRGGWSRWYLVDGGHLHYDVSGSRCSRMPTTEHYWMTEFSGQNGAEVIAQAGERVCTVCFPDAPVNPRPASPRFMTMTEAEKAAYAEDKARKAAAKKAAELRDADGQPLTLTNGLGMTDTPKTDRAAWNWLMREAETLAFYGADKDTAAVRESAERALAALSEKRGTPVEDLRAELNAKTAAKLRKQGATVQATF
jgi:hypothetical protein